MEAQIAFKVYTYWNKEQKPEVRRFAIKKCIVADFNNLTEKLEDVYAMLRGKAYSVSWKDHEGDDVIISSTDEMLVALAAMQGLVKLCVFCNGKEALKLEPAKTVVPDNGKTHGNGNMTHARVICDGCEGNVVGKRYKCITCKDFDLCSKCEAAGEHPEHCMMRIPMLSTQQINSRAVIKKFNIFLMSVGTAIEEEQSKKEHFERSDERRLSGDSHDSYKRFERYSYHDGNYIAHRLTRSGWLEIFTSYMNEYAKLDGGHSRTRSGWLETFTSYMNEYANIVGDRTKMPKQSTENNSPYPFTPDTIQRYLNRYLRKLSPAQPSTTSNAKQTEDVEMGGGDRKKSDADKVSVKSKPSTIEVKKEYSPEKVEGLAVINKEKAAHIESALQNMIAMGFNNDGGWLTQLLESRDGNIAAVLELLSPVKIKE